MKSLYFVHFFVGFDLPLIFCSLTIFCGGLTNIIIQFNFKKNQLSNIESTILLFYDVIQLAVLIYLTGGVTNPFIIFLIGPPLISSTLLNLASTLFLSIITIMSLVLLTFNYFPLPSEGNLHFHVPDYYIYSIPSALVIALIFLNYFGFRFGFEARKRGHALSRLEIVLAKEQELDSIGHQAAAAAHGAEHFCASAYALASQDETTNRTYERTKRLVDERGQKRRTTKWARIERE